MESPITFQIGKLTFTIEGQHHQIDITNGSIVTDTQLSDVGHVLGGRNIPSSTYRQTEQLHGTFSSQEELAILNQYDRSVEGDLTFATNEGETTLKLKLFRFRPGYLEIATPD